MAAAKEDLNTPLIVTIGVVFVVLTFVFIVLLQAFFYDASRAEQVRKVVEPRSEALAGAVAEQQAVLGSYRWTDREQGRFGIPIERAMELVVRDAAGNESR